LDASQLASDRDSFTVEPGQVRFVLSTSHLVDPVRAYWNGKALRALQDFEIDRARGVVVLLHPRAESGVLRVEYHFDPVAAPPRVQLHPMLRQAELKEEPKAEGASGSGAEAGEGPAEAATASSTGLSVSGSKTVSVIDVATGTVSNTIGIGNNPGGVAITPDGTKAYVTNYGGNTVSVIDVATGTITKTISVGASPKGVAIH